MFIICDYITCCDLYDRLSEIAVIFNYFFLPLVIKGSLKSINKKINKIKISLTINYYFFSSLLLFGRKLNRKERNCKNLVIRFIGCLPGINLFLV